MIKINAEKEIDLVVITGPTATGKTRLAATLANILQTEIISADSRQVFRGMDIGTGKDYNEYVVEGKNIPHHLIDIVEAGTPYHIDRYQKDFRKVYDGLKIRNKLPILCGGSGLYINAVINRHEFVSIPPDEEFRKKMEGKSREELSSIFQSMPTGKYSEHADTSTSRRIIRAMEINRYLAKHTNPPETNSGLRSLLFVLYADRETLTDRIRTRLKQRINEGLIEEVKTLLTKVPRQTLINYGLEYKFVTLYLEDMYTKDEMFEKLSIAIRQFSKRQLTWFRKMEREGNSIIWIDAKLNNEERLYLCRSRLKEFGIA